MKAATRNILDATRRNRALSNQQRAELACNLRRAKAHAGFLTVRWSDLLGCFVLWTAYIDPISRV